MYKSEYQRLLTETLLRTCRLWQILYKALQASAPTKICKAVRLKRTYRAVVGDVVVIPVMPMQFHLFHPFPVKLQVTKPGCIYRVRALTTTLQCFAKGSSCHPIGRKGPLKLSLKVSSSIQLIVQDYS